MRYVLCLLIFMAGLLPVEVKAQSLERRADQWLAIYQKKNSSFSSMAAFINAHPGWPAVNRLRAEAEAVLPPTLSDSEVISWFDKNPPQTGTGSARYAAALLNRNRAAEAKKIIEETWIERSMSRDEQRGFYARFGAHITREASIKRLDRQLLRGNYTNARAVAAALGGAYPALAEARIALAMNKGDVDTLVSRVPASLQKDPGLMYERLRWRRKKNLNDGAIEILASQPPMKSVSNPSDWWTERHIIIRRLMETRQYSRAYDLARRHDQSEGFASTQALWVSGFLALRFVNKPWEAFETFERMYHNVETPISRARAAYWAGRASEALKYPDIARQWYQVAAKYQTTFYGQMAASALGMPEQALPPVRPVHAARQSVRNNDMARAAEYLARAGYRDEAALFLTHGAGTGASVAQIEGLAATAYALGQTSVAIRIAQEALNQHGVILTGLLYPTLEQRMGDVRDTEWALAHAIIRQESRFDQNAISSAGARGLMQLMPATAKETARKIGIGHQNDWLTARPDYNIRLGSRYLGDMVRRYDGEYALAAAAYNAGPGRVSQWIGQFGDPRDSERDMIDWIEEIPIYETRNYVQRVLEGVHIYRQIMGTKPVRHSELAHISYKP
jgi:soluble lytic murein transglycosylase